MCYGTYQSLDRCQSFFPRTFQVLPDCHRRTIPRTEIYHKNLLVEITICTFTIFYHRHSYKKYTNLQFHPDMLFVFLFAQLDFED